MAGRKTFGEALAVAMGAKNYNDHKLARGVSVPEARVREWRRDEAVPTRAEFGRVCKHFPEVRGHAPAQFAALAVPPRQRVVVRLAAAPPGTYGAGDYGPESFGGEDFPPVEVEDPPATVAAPPARTFGEALRREREAEDLSQEELGAVLGVTDSAVGAWEGDASCPIRAHYDALVALFPHLADGPSPDWKDMAKPGPAPGSSPRAVADPAPAPPDSAERVVAAYECALGTQGGWELRVSRGADGEWLATMVEEKVGEFYGHGTTVAAAYAVLLRLLGEELDRRREDLDRRREDLDREARRVAALRTELCGGAS